MEYWLLAAILARVIWSLVTVWDKYGVSIHVPHALTYAVFYGLQSLLVIFFIPFVSFAGLLGMPLPLVGLALLNGALYLWLLLYLFRALQREEASRAMMIVELSPAIVLPVAVLFLGEDLGSGYFLAFLFFFVGGILATHRKGMSFMPRHAAVAVFGSLFLASIVGLTGKLLYQNVSFMEGFFVTRVGTVLATLVVLWLQWPKFIKQVREITPKFRRIVPWMVVIDFAGLVLFNYAIFAGPISLVMATGGSMPVLIFFFAALGALFFPKHVHEDITRRSVIKKMVAAVLIAAGIALINL